MVEVQQLIGHWRLVSFVEQQSDGKWTDALGPNAKGSISQSHIRVIGAVDGDAAASLDSVGRGQH